MSEFTSYGVLGAGFVGQTFISALLAIKPTASIAILTRSACKPSSLPTELAKHPRIKIAVVDYCSVSSVAAALKEHSVEVVVDAVHVYMPAFHNVLVDAAKEAGTVKLFVPSEFGFVTKLGEDVSPLAQGLDVQRHLKKVGLPYVVIQAGLFMEYIPIIANVRSGKFYIVGSGDVPFSTTSVQDVAGFLAHLLTQYPFSKLCYTSYRLQGTRTTMREAAARFGLPIKFVQAVPSSNRQELGDSSARLQALLDAMPPSAIKAVDLRTQFQWFLETGKGSVGWDCATCSDDETLAGSGNMFWAGHVWRTVEDVHGLRPRS